MAIPPVTNPTNTVMKASGEASSAQSKTSIDKEAFLKLLVAQMSNQDPLQPTEGTEFVAHLSQFAMVEQAIAQSAKLDLISTQMTGLSSNEAAGLVGQDVTLRDRSKDGAPDMSGKVTKVSFDKGYPEVQLSSGFTAPISDLVSVGGIVR